MKQQNMLDFKQLWFQSKVPMGEFSLVHLSSGHKLLKALLCQSLSCSKKFLTEKREFITQGINQPFLILYQSDHSHFGPIITNGVLKGMLYAPARNVSHKMDCPLTNCLSLDRLSIEKQKTTTNVLVRQIRALFALCLFAPCLVRSLLASRPTSPILLGMWTF